MIAKEQKEAVILETGVIEEESMKMDLDENSKQLLMQMLSKNLYSDPIGSTVRETASNALDSHRRIGVKEPILVCLKKDDNGNWEYSVEDFGTGLDSDDVKNTISKYGKSTKRLTANELGMFGLGFKSPLSYSSSFYFICRKDGIERKYMMYEGEDLNSIDLLYEIETEHRNGVKVIVPVKSGDSGTFLTKIQQQLAYFEDVWFNVHNYWGAAIPNDFKIIREEEWQFSELSKDNYIHLCLDNVYYSLDYRALGIDAVKFPVALRFDLQSGLYPIPNRESIKITEEVKGIILKRLKSVVKWMVDKYNSTTECLENFDEVRQYYATDSKWLTINDHKFDVSELLDFDKSIEFVAPTMTGVEKLNLKYVSKHFSDLFASYTMTHKISNRSIKKAIGSISEKTIDDNYKVFVYDQSIPSLVKEYVRSSFQNKVIFVRKRKDMQLKGKYIGDDSYYQSCRLKNHPKSEWRQVIEEYQSIREWYTSKFIEASIDNIPKEWKDKREARMKAVRDEKRKTREIIKKEKAHGDIHIKFGVQSQRSVADKQCKFEADKLIIDDIPRMKGLVIYDLYENEDRLNYLYEFTNRSINTIFSVSPKEAKKLEKVNYHNLLTYEQFMKGETKPFARIVTADLIEDLVRENSNIFNSYGIKVISRLSVDLSKKLEGLVTYYHNYRSQANGEAKDAMREFAKENNIYDQSIHPLYVEIKELFDSLKIDKVFSQCGYSTESYNLALITLLKEVFKYRKIKLNIEHYSNSNVIPSPVSDIPETEEEEELEEEVETIEEEEEFLF